jgi:hypothetical protein
MATTEEIPQAPRKLATNRARCDVLKDTANEHYEIRAVPGKGYGCFAVKPIKRGTRILADDPLLIVPVVHYMHSNIQVAFDKLSADEQKLYFTLHSGHGQDPKTWPAYIHESVRPDERARIREQHNARCATDPSLVSIFQTNCMEMGQGAAIFLHAARFNHCCNPNACFSWNSKIGKETIHAMSDIEAGEEITISYCDMIHEKRLRAYELKHYGFVCDCRACVDVSDDDVTSFAFQSVGRRMRLGELEKQTRPFRGARLEEGARRQEFVSALLEMAALHQKEGDFTPRLACV